MAQQEQACLHLQVLDEEMAKLREQKGDERYFGGHFEELAGSSAGSAQVKSCLIS